MKRIKKSIALLMVAVMLLSIACACAKKDYTEIGNKGSITIDLEISQKDGSIHKYKVHSDAANLEDLLLETGLVEGEMAQYGLYIKKVEGVEADYDKDQSYWAMKQDGVDLMTGAKDTAVKDGDHFELVYTK